MNIGFQELFLISVIALVVLGPERLPTAIKTVAIWINRFKRSFNEIKQAVEKEIDADDIKRQIHNEEILHKLGESRNQLEEFEQELQDQLAAQNTESEHTTLNDQSSPPRH